MRFAQLKISILQEYATIDLPIVLLKIILVSCVHMCYIQNHAQPSRFCENETFVVKLLVNLVTISRFTYVIRLPYLVIILVNITVEH